MKGRTRILLIDDNADIHEDFRKVLRLSSQRHGDLDDLQAELLGQEAPTPVTSELDVEIDSAYQGEEGMQMALRAAQEGRPYCMAFVDVRMPPGLDGIQTIKGIWQHVPELQCVICTAFSDYDWDEITKELGVTSNLLILKKPFDAIVILQIIQSLAEKWWLAEQTAAHHARLQDNLAELQRARDELLAANTELATARRLAESHSSAKSRFLASISHELRTPLNGVIGMGDLLLDTPLDSRQQKYARTIKSSAELLLELLNEILDFSKIEAGKIELECIDFDLLEVIEAIVRVVALRCQQKQLELSYYVDPRLRCGLRGDPGRLRQILLNLVNNAVKFTVRGEVTLDIRIESETNDGFIVRFCVEDTGIGIPETSQDRLFQAFSQVDSSTSRKYGGTGLGLAICKQLCELMLGTIGVDSEPGRGSRFWYVLPLQRAKKEQPGLQQVPAPLAGARVLVVDDSPTHAKLLALQMRSWGFDSEAATSSGQALEMLCLAAEDERPYSVALIDAVMPGMNGSDLAVSIKVNPRLRDTCLIVMLPLEGRNELRELKAQGFSDFISKPVMQSELFDCLLRSVRAAQSGQPATWTHHQPDAKRESSLPEVRHRNARILVAEDNEVNQDLLLEILHRAGYQCSVVFNGQEALSALARKEFDLVLMDMQMPEMDGMEATRLLRAGRCGPRNAKLPVIALTANAMNSDRDQCLGSGMTDYLSKPLNRKKLIHTLEYWLDQSMGCITTAVTGAEQEQTAPTAETAQTAVLPPPDERPIDLESLVDRCMGDIEFALQMVTKFVANGECQLEELDSAVAAGDAQRVARLAHILKGSAANMSAVSLRDTAFELERLARAGDFAGAREQFGIAQARLRDSHAYAFEALQSPGPDPAAWATPTG